MYNIGIDLGGTNIKVGVILEVAAMNNRQKKMGYNAAQDLLDNLGLSMEGADTVTKYDV